MATSWKSRISEAAQALMGRSVYATNQQVGYELDSKQIESIRRNLGGQLQPIPTTQTQWFLADLEDCWRESDQGRMRKISQLWRAMRRDGYINGLTKTRTSGLVALPKRWRGDQVIIKDLSDANATRSVFDEMFPASELALLAADGLALGIGVAELVPVVGRDYPVMIRLEPEWLWYKWQENRWYFNSVAGALPIDPGDGRWILHTPGGRLSPWQNALWPALGRAFITKEHAILNRANFSSKLANPARVAYTTNAATEAQRQGFLQALIRWGINNVFELPVGWDAKILESNGRGWEVFGTEIDTADREVMIALAGQFVTVTGGTGFANADIHETIRADLIKETADALAETVNTQGIAPYIVNKYGESKLPEAARVEWDIAPPMDRKADADAMLSTAKATTAAREEWAINGMKLDVVEISNRYGIPVVEGAEPIETPQPAMPPGFGDDAAATQVAGVKPPKAFAKPGPSTGPAKKLAPKSSTDDDNDDDED